MVKTAGLVAGRAFLPVLLLFILFSGPVSYPSVDPRDMVVPTLILGVYSFGGLAMFIKYFPRLARATPDRLVFYFCDLALVVFFLIEIYALTYHSLGLYRGNDPVTDAVDFLYFSIVTWTTLGYGDISPASESRLFAAAEALTGYVFMGLYLSVVFHVISVRANQLRNSAEDRT